MGDESRSKPVTAAVTIASLLKQEIALLKNKIASLEAQISTNSNADRKSVLGQDWARCVWRIE